MIHAKKNSETFHSSYSYLIPKDNRKASPAPDIEVFFIQFMLNTFSFLWITKSEKNVG